MNQNANVQVAHARQPLPELLQNGDENAFKPLRLPALAAAVHAFAKPGRQPAYRDLPAFLRDQGFVD